MREDVRSPTGSTDKAFMMPSVCSYFNERQANMLYVFTANPSARQRSLMFENGFRRCGAYWYQIRCIHCHACKAYRVLCHNFTPSRNQKQVLRRNRDLTLRITAPLPAASKQHLFENYLRSRHHNPAAPHTSFELNRTFYEQLYHHTTFSLEFSYYTPEGECVGFGIVDTAPSCASLVYFAFEPKFSARSPGTYHILRAIDWCRNRQIPYLILGLWIDEHPKMNYKKRFRPAQIYDFVTQTWYPIHDE
ncbi:MAG: arginyltransferase [Lentisphaerae bacterium]|nr:MAG: arginyltransferase [Lentisphaerota bacterium]